MTISNAFAAWPSLIFTAIMVVLWAAHVRATGIEYRRERTRARFRTYVVAWTMMVVVLALAASIVAAWTDGVVNYSAVIFISAARSALLIVGGWLAWDRHRHPYAGGG